MLRFLPPSRNPCRSMQEPVYRIYMATFSADVRITKKLNNKDSFFLTEVIHYSSGIATVKF